MACTKPRTTAKDLATARETLNRIAADTAAAPQLQTNGTMRLEGNAGALLVTLAREAAQLFGSDAVKLIRQCESRMRMKPGFLLPCGARAARPPYTFFVSRVGVSATPAINMK